MIIKAVLAYEMRVVNGSFCRCSGQCLQIHFRLHFVEYLLGRNIRGVMLEAPEVACEAWFGGGVGLVWLWLGEAEVGNVEHAVALKTDRFVL